MTDLTNERWQFRKSDFQVNKNISFFYQFFVFSKFANLSVFWAVLQKVISWDIISFLNFLKSYQLWLISWTYSKFFISLHFISFQRFFLDLSVDSLKKSPLQALEGGNREPAGQPLARPVTTCVGLPVGTSFGNNKNIHQLGLYQLGWKFQKYYQFALYQFF